MKVDLIEGPRTTDIDGRFGCVKSDNLVNLGHSDQLYLYCL